MNKALIIGCGYMALEYAKVLQAQDIEFEVIGNRIEKLNIFKKAYPNIICYEGGYQNYLKNNKPFENVIIASSVETGYEAAKAFIENGVKNILTEKPGGLTQAEINDLQSLSSKNNVRLLVAYNRRFYQSIKYAKKIIEKDGGILSAHFEFTEWIHTIDQDKFPPLVLSKFLIANSSHVIDTVFHLVGRPKEINAIISGNAVKWHPTGSIFCGSGITIDDIPFTYHSNWGAPGRWAIEILTSLHRIYFKPMERLSIQNIGSVKIEELNEPYDIDIDFKPGLYLQVEAFLKGTSSDLVCTIKEHQANFEFYEKIAGYQN